MVNTYLACVLITDFLCHIDFLANLIIISLGIHTKSKHYHLLDYLVTK